MLVHQIYTDSPLKNYNYLVELDDIHVLAVDPLDSSQILKWCEDNNKKVKQIIITHEHPDHIWGLADLKKATGATALAHSSSKGLYDGVDSFIEEGHKIPLRGEGELEVLYTPGHSKTHICLLIRNAGKQESIITMDTIFQAGIGHCKLPGADLETLFHSVTRLKEEIEDQVILYSGHWYLENNLKFTLDREPDNEEAKKLLKSVQQSTGDSFQTTIGVEKEINAFFRLDSLSIKKNLNKEVKTEKEIFFELRKLRDNW